MSLQIPLKHSIPPLDCFQYTSDYIIIATLYTENLHEFGRHSTIAKHNYLHYSHNVWRKKAKPKKPKPQSKIRLLGKANWSITGLVALFEVLLKCSKGRCFAGFSFSCNTGSGAAISVCVYPPKKAEGAACWCLQLSLQGSQVTN